MVQQYRVEVSIGLLTLIWILTALGKTTGGNIKFSTKESLGHYELKKHKPWFDEGFSKVLFQRLQAKLQ
jgi:hypothetical protein